MLYLGNSFGLEAFFLQNGALLSGILCVGRSMPGLGLRSMALVVTYLVDKWYWRWCKCQDQDWAKILVHKYFLGADYLDIPRLMVVGKGSCIWETLKKGNQLSKGGLF